jgi:WD40 repeat protein
LASYELSPPTGPEIAQIIREPARAAGLRFEEDADRGHLEDVLQEAAVGDPASLPLLEFVLDALYEAGRDRRLLTFAAYRALGGLEGAIARRADEVVDALTPEFQEALPSVLRGLTTVRLGDETVTARPAPLADLAGSPAQAALVEALIAARLLVSDEDAEGHAVIRVAHEALLSRWPRARDIVNANRSFLETRARVQADAHRWLSDNKNPDLLLPAGKRLAEAEEMLEARREEIDEDAAAYVDASILAQASRLERERQAERMRIEAEEAVKRERLEHEAARRRLETKAAKRLTQRTRVAALVALMLALGAAAGAVVGFRGQQEAIRQAERANANAAEAQTAETKARTAEVQARAAESQARAAETRALEAKDQALRNQSLSLAFVSHRTAATGNTEAAILLASEALPKDMAAPDRPYLPEAEAALYQALLQHRQSTVFHHEGGVTHAAFSATGDRIVTSSYDMTARIWSVENGSQLAILRGHEAPVERASFSPNGSRVATAGRDGTARIWNAASGEQLLVLSQPGNVRTVMFNAAGTRLLTGSDGSAPTVWDTQTGKKVAAAEGSFTTSEMFSPDGLTFASGYGKQRSVRIWSATDGNLIREMNNRRDWPDEVIFSPDGSKLLANTWETFRLSMVPRLWDVPSGSEIAALGDHTSDTQGAAFSHDGRLIATASLDGTARLWDAVSGRKLGVLGRETGGLKRDQVNTPDVDSEMNCAFSADDKLLATASLDNVVRLWDVESASEFAVIPGHRGLVEHVAFSPDGNQLLTASHDGTARLWDVDGVLTTTLRHERPPILAAFSPDGTHVLTGGGDAVAHIWDVASGREVLRLNMGSGSFQYATFNPDGHLVATASSYGSIVLWNAKSGQEIRHLSSGSAAVVNLQFSPDGDLIASASADGAARLWNTSSGNQVAALTTVGNLRKVVFSPDGELVLTALEDHTARLWKRDGTELKALAGHEKRITAAAFSPNGLLVATSSLDGTARVWSIENGSVVATMRRPGEALTDVAFSPDSKSLVTASRDGTVRIWSIEAGAELAVLRGHAGSVTRAAFSPSGLYVVTASPQDRTVRLWSAASGREIAILAGQETMGNVEPATTLAAFNSDGTQIAVVFGDKVARIIRVFPTPQELIDYAWTVVPRELTPCERKRFFLPVEGDVGECPA